MAIIACPECEGKVSDKAPECPHCGFPVNPELIKEPELPLDMVQCHNCRKGFHESKWTCPHCGVAPKPVELPPGMTKCHKCRNLVSESAWQCPHCNAVLNMPVDKNYWKLFLYALPLAILFFLFLRYIGEQ